MLLCFSSLVAMHFFMWKRNQRLQEMVERHRTTAAAAAAAAAVLPMGKTLLTMTRLYQFPTRIVDKVLDEEERRKIETVLLDGKKREALKKSTELNSKEPKRKSVFSKTKLLGKQSSNIVDAPVNNMCVICLEAFKMGDEIRELPCYHEYHITCIDPWLTSKSCECPLCKFDCSDPKLEETTVADPDGLIAANSVPGLHGKILRTYLRFKANRRKRLGQVGITNDDMEHQQQEVRAISRQSTMMSPPSPDLISAFRALDTVEITELPITAIADMDEHYKAYEEAQSNEEVEGSQSFVTDLPRQSTATDRTATTNYRANNTYNETESHSRYSVATTNRDETDTIHTTTANSISTYAPTLDGGLLPDIDVSSISLCSIDLGGLSEDFHNTFNYNR